MNTLRILLFVVVLLGGLSFGTTALAGPISVEQLQIALADSTREPSKTPDPTETPEANGDANDRVAKAIAEYFDVPVSEVIALHDSGEGWGEIVKAYALAAESGKSVAEIMAMRGEQKGWGVIVKLLGEGKWTTNLGQIIHDDAANKKGGTDALTGSNERQVPQNNGKPDDKGKPNDKGKPEGKGKNK